MDDSVKQRLVSYLEYKKISKSEFGRRIGVSASFVGSMRKSIQPDKVNSIAVEFPDLNTGWLLTGEGSMLKESSAVEGEKVRQASRRPIRYWTDVDATGGGVQLFDDTLTNEYIDISIPEFRDCTDAVNIYGDSMAPLYKSGQIIILKEWTENFIDFGNVYLVITRNGNRMVKYLKKAQDDAHVLCVSENPEFDPFEIEKASILKLFIVKGSISKNVL